MPLITFAACSVSVHYSRVWQGTQHFTLLRPCRGARAPMGAEVITLERIPCGSYVGRYGGAPALLVHAMLAPSHMHRAHAGKSALAGSIGPECLLSAVLPLVRLSPLNFLTAIWTSCRSTCAESHLLGT